MYEITCYIPNNSNNPYSENIKWIIVQNGYKLVSIKELIRNPKMFLKCKLFNFNWLERMDSSRSPSMQYLEKKLLIDFLKLTRKKIIYTLHNKEPHEKISTGKQQCKVMELLVRKSDAIIGMCNETLETVSGIDSGCVDKTIIIPHPNYIKNYQFIGSSRDKRKQYGISKTDIVFLFLGFVSPYKNVETLIECVGSVENSNIKLIIAGLPSDKEYQSMLLTLTNKYSNVFYDFRYIPDDEIPDYYSAADIIVLPYRKSSVLNSGAVFLSFSLAKTVICPLIGSIKDFEDKSFLYYYDYISEEDHSKKLKETIDRVIEDIKHDDEIVKQKGKQAKEYVQNNHSLELVREKYAELYKKLIG